jgi:DNA-binding FadR family transcriptional regulator
LDDHIKLLELRLALEAEMASLAALRRDFSDSAAMRSALERMTPSKTTNGAVRADTDFHLAIAKAAKNVYYVPSPEFLGPGSYHRGTFCFAIDLKAHIANTPLRLNLLPRNPLEPGR